MRRAAGLLLVLAAATGSARADTYPRQPGVDVLHYTFRLALADDSDRIEGEATVSARVADGTGEVFLDLAQPEAAPPGRGMTVTAVTEAGQPLSHDRSGDRLRIVLARPGRAGERREIVVSYHGVPAGGLLVGPNKHGDRTFFSDNWPNKARQWLPVVDHPYDKATAEFRVTAPAHYQVVSNGLLVEETDLGDGRRLSCWRQSVPIASWLYVLGVARFAVEHRPAWKGLPVETWVFPQDRDRGFEAFAEPTVAALDFFSTRVGPYSYERLANVQANGLKGGMEAATSILYGDDSVSGPPRRWDSVIVHEIAHQWFGNAVTESDWDDVWLSEGFATYLTHLFVEHAEGRDAFVAGLRADRDQIRAFDLENPGYRIVHDNLSDMKQVTTGAGTYRKGAWTLHMLRGVVGDEAFWSGIREYYRLYRDKNASTADFRRVMEEASGRELGWFFDQWLHRGGMLKVEARWSWDAATRVLRLDLEQLQAADPYRMPVEVAIEVAGEAERRTERIELRERRQSFAIPLDREPRSVVLDPRDLVLMDADVHPVARGPELGRGPARLPRLPGGRIPAIRRRDAPPLHRGREGPPEQPEGRERPRADRRGHRGDRRGRGGQVLARLRRALRRGPPALRGDLLPLRPAVPRAARPAPGRADRGRPPGGRGGPHRARPHLPIDGRHDDLGRRLPAGALRPRRDPPLPPVRAAGRSRLAVVHLRGAGRGRRGPDRPRRASRTGWGRRWGPASSARPSRRRDSVGCSRTARRDGSRSRACTPRTA